MRRMKLDSLLLFVVNCTFSWPRFFVLVFGSSNQSIVAWISLSRSLSPPYMIDSQILVRWNCGRDQKAALSAVQTLFMLPSDQETVFILHFGLHCFTLTLGQQNNKPKLSQVEGWRLITVVDRVIVHYQS